MKLTVGELRQMLAAYPNDYEVEFQNVFLPDGRSGRLQFYRIDDRGVCHFEWNPLLDEDIS